MTYYMQKLIENLSSEDERFLRSIYAPTIVAIPPTDAACTMTVTLDGEIRIYGTINKNKPEDKGDAVYISSKDAGLSWKMHFVSSPDVMCAATYNKHSGRWIACSSVFNTQHQLGKISDPGTYVFISNDGPDHVCAKSIKLSDLDLNILKKPLYIEEYDRWFILGEYRENLKEKFVHIFISDDDGETWTEQKLPHAPPFEITPPHQGTRWQEYSCEPTIANLGNGKLMMLVRTSQNYHYVHYSYDGGSTWTDPVPSPFHGTITMPVLFNHSDGRIILFWCNTQPLPELDHATAMPMLDETEKNGVWEDVFTNRDANHLAITSDGGLTWQGFRELLLNPIRNYADFRSIGGIASRDKSVHQAQILELPFNKLLVCCGQGAAARKVIILDLAWLYETNRFENFQLGLSNISTQMYIKSNLGGYRGFSGHCAYNRTNGATLVPDPDMNHEEVLQICRMDDPRLVYPKQGAVWNFPIAKKGYVDIQFMILSSGISLSLTDRWFNPVDEYVQEEAFFSIAIDSTFTTPNVWHTLRLEFDTQKNLISLILDQKQISISKAKNLAPMGLCYLHLQTLAESCDYNGTYIKSLAMSAK